MKAKCQNRAFPFIKTLCFHFKILLGNLGVMSCTLKRLLFNLLVTELLNPSNHKSLIKICKYVNSSKNIQERVVINGKAKTLFLIFEKLQKRKKSFTQKVFYCS